jgi:cephalosporin hydroxylase
MAQTAEAAELISGDLLKAATVKFLSNTKARLQQEQKGLLGIFDSWFTRVVKALIRLDKGRPWEDSVSELAARSPAQGQGLQWDLQRLRLFLDRWQQGRFVEFAERERTAAHYHPRYGTEFGIDVLLTCQGAPTLMRWRGTPLLKTVFDFAIYPALISELRPRTIFEIGSGLGGSAVWFADHLALCGIEGRVHSVDLKKAEMEHPGVSFYQGDCADPDRLFDPELLHSQPHPWLVVEDAHHNVADVIERMHQFLLPGDYLVVEDSEVKRPAIRQFLGAHPGNYLVDTRFTDYFGRNATCAGDSIFVRIQANDGPRSQCEARAIPSPPRDN